MGGGVGLGPEPSRSLGCLNSQSLSIYFLLAQLSLGQAVWAPDRFPVMGEEVLDYGPSCTCFQGE